MAGSAALLLLAVAMIKGCGGGADLGPVVHAQQFVVRSPDGKQRAVFGMVGEDRVYLSIFDAGGRQRAAVGVEDDGPSVKLFNKDGKVQAVLDLLGERPRLSLFDKDGRLKHKAP